MIILEKARMEYSSERRAEPPAFLQLFDHCQRFSRYKTETSTRDARAAVEYGCCFVVVILVFVFVFSD
jgi:hypothetical protein